MKSWVNLHGSSFARALFLFAITMMLFWPATRYDLLNFDDDRYVSGNPIVQQGLTMEGISWAFRSIYHSCWLPLLWLSYMVDTTLFGPQPFGYHFTNVILHALNAALVYLLLQVWTRKAWHSFFVAALFAWHPLRVESVAWVAERKDVLSGFLFLICLFAYTRYCRNPTGKREVAVAFFMALGLMSKPILVTLPFLMLLLDYWPLNRWNAPLASIRAKLWSLISEKVLFWSLAAVFSYLAYYAHVAGGAIHGPDVVSLTQRLIYMPAAYGFYLLKMFFPVHLSVIYGELEITTLQSLSLFVLFLGITLVIVWAGRRCQALPVGWFWFLGLLVPVIGLVRFGVTHIADRFTYLPSIGFGILVAWGVSCFIPQKPWARRLALLAALAILIACAWQTRRVLPNWSNSLVAFENVLRYLPYHGLANNNYGEALMAAGRTELALQHFEKAALVDSNTTPFIANSALALLLLHRPEEAIVRLETALNKKDPDCPFLNFTLGLSWMEIGKPERAIPLMIKANESPMRRPPWQMELARAYLEAGKMAEASNAFAVSAPPGVNPVDDFEGLCQYYSQLWSQGHGRRAWSFFGRVVHSHSNNVGLLNNVSWLLATDPPAGVSPEEAVRLALQAKSLSGTTPNPSVVDTLAAAYAAKGDYDQAVQWAERARELASSNELDQLASMIDLRIQAYRAGKAWGKSGPRD